MIQWFERNRFELHPENAGTSNEVQLGLLGHELRAEARLADPDFRRTEQLLDPALPTQQQWYFEETGHNLRFCFLQYWLQNGGLTRFGYRISEEYRELDQANSKVFLVQWFERARFELHPENRPPNDVLLGLLSNQIKKPSSPVEYMWKLGKGYITPGNFSGLTVDGEGYVYVADAGTGHLLKYNQAGKLVNWWDKALSDPGDVSNNLSLQAWLLSVGVAQDKQGNVYVAYTSDIQAGVGKYDRSGKLLQQIGSRGSGLGQFYNPSGLAIDKDNYLYVAEGDLHGKDEARIQKFDSTGRFLLAFGEYKAANNSGSNFSEEALLKHPAGLAVDSQSNVYVLEPGGTNSSKHLIRKFDSQGNFLLSWGALVSAETVGNDPSNKNKPEPKDGEFSTVWYLPAPVGIAIDNQDNVYVTDPVNQRIQKFDGNGNFLAKLKNRGTAQEAQYNSLALDNQNNLYVTDFYNCLVQKYSPDGKLLLEYGNKPETQNPFDNPLKSYLDSFELDHQSNFYITGTVSDNDFITKYILLGNFSTDWLYQIECL